VDKVSSIQGGGESSRNVKQVLVAPWSSCCIKLNLEGQGRQPPLAATSCHCPTTTYNRQPPLHLKFDFSYF